MKTIYRVVAGIVVRQNCILCGRRTGEFFSSKWEFPGGKIELEETKIDALKREIKEEIDCEVTKAMFFYSSVAEAEAFVIYLDTYLIKCIRGTPKAIVHNELKWIPISKLNEYDWCPADKVIVDHIITSTFPPTKWY